MLPVGERWRRSRSDSHTGPDSCRYAAALLLQVLALAVQGGSCEITVHAVAPRVVRTGMSAAVRENADVAAAIEADTAPGRCGEVSDLAAMVAFPAADEGRRGASRSSR
ncbi:SDR family oxidoreductase [Streptomyces argenteolus]|uniref:SDR family oxidoreductase n=1 Tax=Streptomyces argenteolus TaxID=67274 RepID=A0ABW6X6V4_9ACTN